MVVTRPVKIDLPVDVHKLLRLQAAQLEVSMSRLAKTIVQEHLERAKGRPATVASVR